MGLLDYVARPPQSVAYLFPELSGLASSPTSVGVPATSGDAAKNRTIEDVFVFQFWPQQIQDNYTPNYATKNIPGASHPIYQWTSGSGREISFTANFVSELREDTGFGVVTNRDFRSRISGANAKSITNDNGVSAPPTSGTGFPLGPLLLPSARYTINVSAAIAALQQYLYPDYTEDVARPPKKLVLVLPGTNLGRKKDHDGILCILRSAPVTMESFFPNGEIRSASVNLRFSEIVQHSGGDNVSKIKYIGAEEYKDLADRYKVTITNPNELSLG